MIVSPGIGFGSKSPQAVCTLGRLGSLAKAGRSLNSESPFRSRPTVMLKGRPEVCEMKGEKRRFSGPVKLPPRNVWNFASKPARLYSLLMSYWLAGKEAALSVLLFAFPTVKYPNRVIRRLKRALMLVMS